MTIRVLVVDDSAFMRKMITQILNSDPEIEVIATARDGEDAIKKVEKLRPDVVTLDVEMPRVDGLTALAYIMNKSPLPVVMLSALTGEGTKATVKALSYGAVDYIQKPSGTISLDIEKIRDEIIRKVKLAANARVRKLKLENRKPKKIDFHSFTKKLVVIGASTGGPQALVEIISHLPKNIPASILVVQHMPKQFTRSFAERLDSLSEIEVEEAEEGDRIIEGKALLAPGDYHMLVNNSKITLDDGPKINSVRPAVDPTMISAAEAYGENVIGVILTGMGNDGAYGIKVIKEKGGTTIAQDESTSVVFGMPKAAIATGCVDKVLPLHEISKEIIALLGGKAS